MKNVSKFMTALSILLTSNLNASSPETLQIVTEHLPPFQIFDKGEIKGYATEIIRSSLNIEEVPYKISAYPWPRAFKLATEEPNTCIYSIARSPEREDKLHWLTQITSTKNEFFGLADNKSINIQTVEDVKRYNVAVIRNDIAHEMLLNLGFEENKNLFVINNTFSMLKQLISKKGLDLILVDPFAIHYRAEFHKLDPKQFQSYMELDVEPFDLYFACNKNTDEKTLKKLQASLDKFKASDAFDELKMKWRGKGVKNN